MNHRERELAAIRHEIPGRIPVDAIAVENTAAVAAHVGITEAEVTRRLGLDGRCVGIEYAGPEWKARHDPDFDEWGAFAGAGAVYGGGHAYPLGAAVAPGEVERYRYPDPAGYDYARAAAAAGSFAGEYAVRGPYWQPLFCRVCSLAGMETALVWMAAEPALFEAAIEAVFERTFELCREFIRGCGAALDIFCLGDDFATQRGMLFDPELWRRYLKRRYEKLFELGKAAGKFVWFHSCGDITAVLPDLIDIGMDVWETVQLHTLPLSPEELKREYGAHLTFFGGVSTQRLPFAEPDAVAAEVTRCIDALGEGGGYICGPDHHVKPDVPAANALALFDTARAYRRRGYTAR